VIEAARGIPLFLFLDPCGALLPFDRLGGVVGGAHRSTRPRTEVLLNFSADFTRRAAGQLAAGRTEEAGIARLDATCGGLWWRAAALEDWRSSADGTFEAAAEAVVAGYAQRLARAGSMLHVTVPVRRHLRYQPVYHLVFLTRSPYGLWVFADALGLARQAWLGCIGQLTEKADGCQTVLWSGSESMRQVISAEEAGAQEIIQENLRRLVRDTSGFRLVERAREVFGNAYGVATDKTVAAAWRQSPHSASICAALIWPARGSDLKMAPSGCSPSRAAVERSRSLMAAVTDFSTLARASTVSCNAWVRVWSVVPGGAACSRCSNSAAGRLPE
jgi:hypothetical protein